MLCISFLVGALSGSEFAPFLMDNMCVICNRLSFIYKQQQAFRERQTSAEYLKLICPKALILKFFSIIELLALWFLQFWKGPLVKLFLLMLFNIYMFLLSKCVILSYLSCLELKFQLEIFEFCIIILYLKILQSRNAHSYQNMKCSKYYILYISLVPDIGTCKSVLCSLKDPYPLNYCQSLESFCLSLFHSGHVHCLLQYSAVFVYI